MEPINPPPTLISKRMWHIVRVVYFMFRKGVSKRKVMTFDINLLLKRGKLASKKAIGNLLSHHHVSHGPRSHHQTNQKANEKEEEREEEVGFASPSPLQFWTFGKSPDMVRQLRITDSPFPMKEEEEERDERVDEEAEEFIARFYEQLRRQQWMDEMENGKRFNG